MSHNAKHTNNTPLLSRSLETAALGIVLIALVLGCAQDKAEQEVASGDPDHAPYVEAPVDVAPAQDPVPTPQKPPFQMEMVEPERVPGRDMPPAEPKARFGYSEPSGNAPLPQYTPRSLSPQAPGGSPNLQRSTAPQLSPYSQPQAMPSQVQPPQAMEAPPVQPRIMEAPPQMQPMEAAPQPEPAPAEVASEIPFDVVEVFYGTDRAPMIWPGGVLPHKFHALLPAITCVILGLAVALLLTKFKQYIIAGLTVVVAASGAVVVGQEGWVQYHKYDRFLSNDSVVYGKEQGDLQLGTCKISIPKTHQAGQLEAPSVLHWEFEEKQEDHVMLMEVKSQEEQEFFDMLKSRVEASPGRDLLIFIHGYNVTFEDAARRTAQISHDLEFQGAPVFFSWPSQGELLGYVTDRGNSFWTASHLKEFLLKVHQHSGAQSVHLIAHSMGNRAFGTAVEALAQDLQQNQKIFNEVILAAPDVDARVFQEKIAPSLTSMAHHVTLYASQNDVALMASRAVNGYPRAGDVGANILILNGIDTIDVTQIDTSLMGHAYYGDNTTVISDIYALLQNARMPTQRQWLRDISSPGGMYWYFDPQYNNAVTRAPSNPPLR
ncbi:alpha/beta hydrolase [Bremerella sp. JC770]|uniref:alpha/beta hydrolase n=1 Tax=Bremerella sp. JC770 TaxID=3232137 RepID=UPI00345A9A6F